jgi:DNA-binding CsgD family transcriptional regulator
MLSRLELANGTEGDLRGEVVMAGERGFVVMGGIRSRFGGVVGSVSRSKPSTALTSMLCAGLLAAGIIGGLMTRDFDEVLLAITPVVILIAAALLPRVRALEMILATVTLHFVFLAAGLDGVGPRYLDVVVIGGSALIGIVATRPSARLGWRSWDLLPQAASSAGPVSMPAAAGGGHELTPAPEGPPMLSLVADTDELSVLRQLRNRLGDSRLSQRQQEVIQLVLQGMTARQIGARLFISERTVETHLANVYERLGVHSRMELIHNLSQPVPA